MMRLLRKLHKWIGLLIGVQVLLWLLSGLMISLLDPEKVSGKQWASTSVAESQTLGPEILLEPAELSAGLLKDVLGLDLSYRHGKPVYLVKRADSETLVDATDGSIIVFDKTGAEQVARKDFTGDGGIVSIESGMAPERETRDNQGAYWRVNFSDRSNTSIYISASTGEILERRNSFWRVRDFFWMLHIMDYPGRENFNNPLIITVALIAIWLGISGFILLFGSFNRSDFFFLNIPGTNTDVVITLIDPGVSKPHQVRLRRGSNLFLSLATHDVSLASVCGGGGECGKCRVRFETADFSEPNDVELGLIPKRLREQGYRLACQQKAEKDMILHLPAGTLRPGQ
jgi:Na+-transporting NADH:ubiquinone oxidoreductase subunit F